MKKGMTWCLLASLIVVGVLVAGCSKGGSTAGIPTAGSPPAATPSLLGTGGSLADLINGAKQHRSFTADFTSTASNGRITSGTMWVQGKQFKMETTVNGAQEVMIYNYDDSSIIMYQPASGRGQKMKLTQNQNKSPGDYLNAIDMSKAQDLGTAAVNGEACRGIQYVDANGSTIKMWLSVAQDFPVQIISALPDGTTTTTNYTNVKVGALPGDTFSVPAGVTIVDLSNMHLPSQQ